MGRKELTKVLSIGSIAFIGLSLLIRLTKSTLVGSYSEPFPWANQVGIGLMVFSLIVFVLERYSDKPFFYGFSQRGGSNANSFVVCAVGLNFLHLSNKDFVISAIDIIICIFALGNLAWSIKHRTSH